MSIRTTNEAVQGILGANWDGSTDLMLSGFIPTASAMVDQVALKDTKSQLSSTILELIERWLAAHYYAVADQTMQSKSTGKANATFEGKTDMGLRSTRYGCQAIDLDFTRYLAALNNKGVVGFVQLGTNVTCGNGTAPGLSQWPYPGYY